MFSVVCNTKNKSVTQEKIIKRKIKCFMVRGSWRGTRHGAERRCVGEEKYARVRRMVVEGTLMQWEGWRERGDERDEGCKQNKCCLHL